MAAHARTSAMVGLGLVAAVTAGCSGSGSTASKAPPPSGSSSSSSPPGAQNNAAPTESNPPGDIPDNQVYVAFGGTGFTVKVPEGWARTQQGAATAFTDKLNTVRIQEAKEATAPTVGSVTNTVLPRLRSQVPKFASPKVSEVTRHAGRVVLVTYQGDSAKDPVTGKVVRDAFERYAFYRSGREVDLTLSGPVNADNVDPWRIISDSFAWR
ncbi:hypothetical protein [Streptomyces sp. Ag109_G2-15]|uniref:hypothetical protein n=1 Tax=Streptomyces sp. Ag109_G2-15 TaxID=1938850 RepID=UPI000BD64D75|nr:hypothetical protein [Streptomyces sp. Ag109_G2-15]SOE08168.1 hypothetical protein SAMN06272765_9096 [Streptomyces sp. Ag109_G2-15]